MEQIRDKSFWNNKSHSTVYRSHTWMMTENKQISPECHINEDRIQPQVRDRFRTCSSCTTTAKMKIAYSDHEYEADYQQLVVIYLCPFPIS